MSIVFFSELMNASDPLNGLSLVAADFPVL